MKGEGPEFSVEPSWVAEGRPRPVTPDATGAQGEKFEVGTYVEAAVTGEVTGTSCTTQNYHPEPSPGRSRDDGA